MKVLACADLHLGAGGAYGRQPHGEGSRLADQEQVWLRVCDLAVDQDVDAVLFAGDAFHRRKPTPAEILAFRAGLDRLCMHGIPVFAIPGNHDTASMDVPCALDIFTGELELWRTPGVRHFPAIGTEQQATLAFLPWVPTSKLIAELGHRTDTDAIHRDTAELLVHVARGLRAECTEHVPAILVAHWSVTGASTPTGAMTEEFREPVLPLGDLEAMGWDAVVLGHIHKPQQLGHDPGKPIFYCGSPCVVDFGEADTEHGVALLDLDLAEGSPTPRIDGLDRPFVTLDYDFTADSAYSLDDEIARRDWNDTVVRVRYRATADQANHVDHAAITRALYDAGTHHVYAIQPEIVREDRARVAGVDETLTPLGALDLWIDHQSDQWLTHTVFEAMRERAAGYLEEIAA